MQSSTETIHAKWRALAEHYEPEIQAARQELEEIEAEFEDVRQRRAAALDRHRKLQDRYSVEWESVAKVGGAVMSTETVEPIERERSVEELREEYEAALQRERELVAEIRALAADEESAVEAADEAMISEVARRRLELPMRLAVVMRRRARLLLQVAEAELEEASAERSAALEKVNRAEKQFRKAEARLEEERTMFSGADGEYQRGREQALRAREGLNNVMNMDASAVVQRLAKGAE